MRVVAFRATNTHLYPGARLRLADEAVQPGRGDAVQVEFADLGTVRGRVGRVEGGRLHLEMQAHRTQRGTEVAAKSWIAEPLAGADGRGTYRVLARGGRS